MWWSSRSTFAWGAGAALVQLWPKAKWSYFKHISNDCHYFTSALSDKIWLESQRSDVKECFTRATARHNSKQSSIHHTSSPELSFSLSFYSLCYRISGSTSSLLARQSRRFFEHHSTHLPENEKKNQIMWCGPRLRPNFCKMARGPKSLATPGINRTKGRSMDQVSTFPRFSWSSSSLSSSPHPCWNEFRARRKVCRNLGVLY